MHDPQRPDLWSTAELPVLEPARVYRASAHRRRIAIGAGTGLVLLVVVIWAFSAGGSTPVVAAPSPSSVATTTPPAAATTQPTEAATTTSPTPRPTVTTTRPLDPDQAVDQLRDVIASLKDDGKLDRDDAKSLNRRLDDVADKIKDGDRDGATRKLDQFAKKLVDLQKDDDLGSAGFQDLAAGANQVALALPQVQEG